MDYMNWRTRGIRLKSSINKNFNFNLKKRKEVKMDTESFFSEEIKECFRFKGN